MMIWNDKLISKALDQAVGFEFEATGFQFNSKDVKPGDIFIALKGSSGDGHNYIDDAINKGAVAVIAERQVNNHKNIILVDDSSKALTKLANFKRSNVKAKYIGITGSVGKTSTKEMVAAFFSAYGKTTKTEGNFNNDLGVPITLARMPMDAEYAVIEMGMSAEGEIETLTKMVDPKVCIITNVEAVHLEFFDSVEKIADAKSEIFKGNDKDRIAIINIDNKYSSRMVSNAKNYGVKSIKTFGRSADSDISLKQCGIADNQTFVQVSLGNTIYEYYIPVIGEHQAMNSLIAILAAYALGLDPNIGIKSIKHMEIAKGRGEIFDIAINGKNITVVNEAYNSSPAALKAVLKAYAKKFKDNRKIAILGDMKELGDSSYIFHKDIANDIEINAIELVVCVGNMMKYLYDAIPAEKQFGYFINVDEMINSDILNNIKAGDVLILKGSNSVKLYKMADYLKSIATK